MVHCASSWLTTITVAGVRIDSEQLLLVLTRCLT